MQIASGSASSLIGFERDSLSIVINMSKREMLAESMKFCPELAARVDEHSVCYLMGLLRYESADDRRLEQFFCMEMEVVSVENDSFVSTRYYAKYVDYSLLATSRDIFRKLATITTHVRCFLDRCAVHPRIKFDDTLKFLKEKEAEGV